MKTLSGQPPSPQLDGLLSFVGEDVMWWIRLDNVIDIAAVPRAVQRLWSAAEVMLPAASPYAAAHGGIYAINQRMLDAIYSEDYVVELDKLGGQHGAAMQITRNP